MVAKAPAGTRHALYNASHVFYVIIMVVMTTDVESRRSYAGSKVFRVEVPELDRWDAFLTELRTANVDESQMSDIWRHPVEGGFGDIHIHQNDINNARMLLQKFGLEHHVTIQDVEKLVSMETTSNRKRQKRSTHSNDVIGHYARYDEIVKWMDEITTKYPSIAKMVDIGATAEGRRMKVLKLGSPGRHKWKVWIDGGIHAREWISPATVLFLADQLLEGYMKKDNLTKSFLDTVHWYFLPVVNPDGYEYSHTQDRLWRKNRKLDNGTGCHGVDLNRNWRFQWGGAYSSSDPCDNVFRGNSPEDELEVKNIVNFLSPRADAFIAFMTYHSYGQRFITRWDYSKEVVPRDHDQLMSLAERAVSIMHEVHGTMYEAGRSPELMYPYGGGSPDWAKAIANIKYSYLIELRDQHTFILPPEEIVPTGQENWAAIRVIGREILDYYGDILAPHVDDPPYWTRDNSVTYRHENEVEEKMAVVFHTSEANMVLNTIHVISFIFLLLCHNL